MLLSPLQNTAVLMRDWVQKRPHITQVFGVNPQIYAQFGLKGHNGIDFRAPVGTLIFAPCEGTVQVRDEGKKGYGLYIRIVKDNAEIVIAHLSTTLVRSGDIVRMGDLIGHSGNSGFSTGPHVHYGVRFRNKSGILNYNNGFAGYIDPSKYTITWKGTFAKNTL